jgi:hypothetical protein
MYHAFAVLIVAAAIVGPGIGTLVVIVLGTLVIFTFDPCIDPNSTLDVCRMK